MEVLKVTSKNFEEEVLKSEKTVLIDFYADWCGPCKMLSPIIEAVANENEEIKVVKINVDNEQDLAIEYQVMSIPTIVVIKNGKETNKRWIFNLTRIYTRSRRLGNRPRQPVALPVSCGEGRRRIVYSYIYNLFADIRICAYDNGNRNRKKNRLEPVPSIRKG